MDLTIDLTRIVTALLGLFAALITYRLVPYIKAKTTNEQQAYIRALVKAGVYAAEQIYNTEDMGRQKMAYVREFLRGHGFDVNITEIEAAVAEYINHPPEYVVTAPLALEENTEARDEE